MKKIILIGLLLIVLISGCKSDTYTAYKDDVPVLEFYDKPGYLTSTGYFPDEEPTKHPFIDARALTPDYEDELGQLIRDSVDFDEFLDLLWENGYDIYRGEVKVRDGKELIPKGAETEIDVIKVYLNRNLIDGEPRSVEIADIIVNNEKGEIIVSTTTEGKLLDALMEAIDAAKSTNLTLEFEEFDIIDGERVLVMYGKNINITDENYIWSLRYFLSFDYPWGISPFEFDIVKVSKEEAYKNVNPIGVGCSIEQYNSTSYSHLDWEFSVEIPMGWSIHESTTETSPGAQILAPGPKGDIDFSQYLAIYFYTEEHQTFPSIEEYISRKTLPLPEHTVGEVIDIEVNGYKGKMFDSTRPYPDVVELPSIDGLIKSREVLLQGDGGFYLFRFSAPEKEFESSCGVLGHALESLGEK